MILPSIYVILDHETLARHALPLTAAAEQLREAGVTLVQWRHKNGSPREILAGAGELQRVFRGDARLILNDRADLAVLAGFAGVHVGQGDLSPHDAKTVAGGLLVGVSTHTDPQVTVANMGVADYVAIGPVFATGTKVDAAPVVGLDGVRRARALTDKPLVAIGGITRKNARAVIDAGADSVAVITGVFVPGERIGKVAQDFLDLFR